ncbi:MAG: DUF2442 domain-containing protein [Chloroflexi bacterium]|nr:DUF2442 domain-containing protein [Chloroflexota bacterium]
MNTSAPHPTVISPTAVLAVDVSFTDDALHVRLSDGREVSVPLEWFPRLRDATPKQRANWRLIARGIGMHWEDVDEDIAVTTLLRAGWTSVEKPIASQKQKRRQKTESLQTKRPPGKRIKPAAPTRAGAKVLANPRRSRKGRG